MTIVPDLELTIRKQRHHINNKNMKIVASEIIDTLLSMSNEEQKIILSRFFKTGKGEYGEGDKFLGIKVPQTRLVVKQAKLQVPISEIEKLIYSEWHEVRVCGFLLLIEEMNAALPKGKQPFATNAEQREQIIHFYLQHAKQANNWDLVDLSAPKILGNYLLFPKSDDVMPKRTILDELAISDNLWEQRIAIVTNWTLIRQGQYDDTFRISSMLLHHPHDLIHKAVGWMLREVGNRDLQLLEDYLESHYKEMHRTTLRYAIEKMKEPERKYWLTRI